MHSKPKPDSDLAGRLARAVALLRDAQPVIVPTETVYGVACDARSEPAVQRVFTLKGRPETNPLPVLVRDVAQARSLVSHWPEVADRLTDAFWPGALTIVLPLALGAGLAHSVTLDRGSVALRCSAHDLAHALAEAFDGPLALTSANRSGLPPARSADDARAFLVNANAPDVLVLDAGACAVGQPSTIVRVTGEDDDVEILRDGALSEDDILDALQ